MDPMRQQPEPRLPSLLRKLCPVDLVVVEGYKSELHPKLEIYRAALGRPLLAPGDPAIVAIASDVALPGIKIPVIDLDDMGRIVDTLIQSAAPIETVLAKADAS